jgi:hypothetical protein
LGRSGVREAPNPNIQAPENFQTQNSKLATGMPQTALDIGTWCFFGCWGLEFGAFHALQPFNVSTV